MKIRRDEKPRLILCLYLRVLQSTLNLFSGAKLSIVCHTYGIDIRCGLLALLLFFLICDIIFPR